MYPGTRKADGSANIARDAVSAIAVPARNMSGTANASGSSFSRKWTNAGARSPGSRRGAQRQSDPKISVLGRETRRFGLGQADREPLLFVGPFADQAPAGGAQQQAAVAIAVFVTVLGVDGIAGPKGEALARDGEIDVAPRFQVHLDPAQRIVPDRA